MHTRLLPLYLCFFLSGSAALIYEIVWQRMLTLVFGVSTWSIAAVLSAYMAGLALGAWAFGRLADRTHHVVRAYGLVELGILLTGIAVSWSIDPLMAVYVKLAGGSEHGYYFTHLIRFALALAVFVVPSTLIGGTIPLMSRMVARHAGALGIGFGRFYAVNTLGAVLGAGLAGFVLIRFIGMHASVYVAAAGNALAALIALTLGSGQPAEHPVAAPPEPPDEVVGNADRQAQPVRPLYLLAGLAGLSALGYEVAWARLLAVYTLNSVYVFTMLLTVFLAALAIGSGIGARLMRARPGDTLWHVTLVQLAIGLTGPAVLVIGRFATDIGFALQGGSAGKGAAAGIRSDRSHRLGSRRVVGHDPSPAGRTLAGPAQRPQRPSRSPLRLQFAGFDRRHDTGQYRADPPLRFARHLDDAGDGEFRMRGLAGDSAG
jgi:spermidine synthase